MGIEMPTISMFYGILVSLLFEDNDRRCSKASIAIEDGRLLAGDFPPKQLRLVQAWVEIHRDELLADWELAVHGEEPFKIAPLQ
jgi:hypothetical protein